MTTETDRLLTVPDALERIGVGDRTLRRYIAAGLTVYVIDGERRICESELLAIYRQKHRNRNASLDRWRATEDD